MLVGCLLGIVVGEFVTVSPGCSIGCKLGLFSGADVGLFVVGTKKFQAGCNVGSLVGSLVEGGGEGFLV